MAGIATATIEKFHGNETRYLFDAWKLRRR